MTVPTQAARLLDRRHERGASRDDAAGDVAVAVEVLRRALHREVDAQRERLLVDRAGERVVDDRQRRRARGRRRRSRRMSTQRSVGLIGDSNQTSRVAIAE